MFETEIKEKQYDTLAKYGTHTITVSEIYNGNIKSNDVQTMISFSIYDDYFNTGTHNFSCIEGITWADWADTTSGTPFYTDSAYHTCGFYGGSLQELILEVKNNTLSEHGYYGAPGVVQLLIGSAVTGLVDPDNHLVQPTAEIKTGTYTLSSYED